MAEKADLDRNQIIEQLIRLDSGRMFTLKPPERLQVALEAEKLGIDPVARKYALNTHVVNTSVRDVTAALIYLSIRPDTSERKDVKKQVNKLKCLDQELMEMEKQTLDPEVNKILGDIPHMVEILDSYFHFRSVKPLFNRVDMPYNQAQLKTVRRYLKTGGTERTLNGLASLSRRYVFAKWLSGFGDDPDKIISQAAEYVLSNESSKLSPRQSERIGTMRAFLTWCMDKEYASMGGTYALSEDLTLFPENYSGTSQEVITAYRRYGDAGFCPQSLKDYAQLVVNEIPRDERIATLGTYRYYSIARLRSIDWAGIKFLENVLIWPKKQFQWSMFMVDTIQVLKEAKHKMLE